MVYGVCVCVLCVCGLWCIWCVVIVCSWFMDAHNVTHARDQMNVIDGDMVAASNNLKSCDFMHVCWMCACCLVCVISV